MEWPAMHFGYLLASCIFLVDISPDDYLVWCICFSISFHRLLIIHLISGTGVLLGDLLVAEDLAAAETTSAASHAAAAAAASSLQPGRSPGRYIAGNERTRQANPEAVPDGAVVLGTPVAPPVNGDMYTDISTENAMLQGPR